MFDNDFDWSDYDPCDDDMVIDYDDNGEPDMGDLIDFDMDNNIDNNNNRIDPWEFESASDYVDYCKYNGLPVD